MLIFLIFLSLWFNKENREFFQELEIYIFFCFQKQYMFVGEYLENKKEEINHL